MADDVQVLQSGYDAFNRGDPDGIAAVFADDMRWEGPNATELPGGGTHEGKAAVMQMLAGFGERWETFSSTPDEFHPSGDTVVVLGHTEAKARATGQEVKVPFVHIWRMRDGVVARGQILTDTLVVADALGLR